MLSLVLRPGSPEEQSFVLPVGTVTIGRTSDNLVCCAHKSLSRRHARVDYDGVRLLVTDLQSKNGIFYRGQRVATCEPTAGESFRCGDVMVVVESATARQPRPPPGAQTLPSPLHADVAARGPVTPQRPRDEGPRHRERLLMLVRATEQLVVDGKLDAQLDELVGLTVQAIEVDRVVLLLVDRPTGELVAHVVKTFAGASPRPYSARVVDWVATRGAAGAFADVSQDRSLPGDALPDGGIRSAMAAPLLVPGGTGGVLYADRVAEVAAYGADEVDILRALANVAASLVTRHALQSGTSPPSRPLR